jgi:hypothetical protein
MRRRNSPWLCEDWEKIVAEVESLALDGCLEVQNKGIVEAASTPHDPASPGAIIFSIQEATSGVVAASFEKLGKTWLPKPSPFSFVTLLPECFDCLLRCG